MRPAALAALAAVAAVWGAWEALAALEALAPAQALARVLAPARRAGEEGRLPTLSERRRLGLLGTGVLLAGGWLLAGPWPALAAAAGGPAVVSRVLAARRRRWRRALAAAVPAVARGLADALAGGHSIRGGLQELARAGALPGPAGAEMRRAARSLALGARTDDVLGTLRARAADPAWDTFTAAVLLQRDAGGDLAALLRAVAEAREDAARAEAAAHGLTAQARATARMVAGLPAGALGLAELLRPGTLAGLLGDPRARLLALAGLLLGGAGLWVVARLARLEDDR